MWLSKPRQNLLDLSGNRGYSMARIAIESLPDNAEPVSEDEVILNGPRKSKEELIDCSNELNLTLKQGKMIMLSGIYEDR